jgi:hypothetical protein
MSAQERQDRTLVVHVHVDSKVVTPEDRLVGRPSVLIGSLQAQLPMFTRWTSLGIVALAMYAVCAQQSRSIPGSTVHPTDA